MTRRMIILTEGNSNPHTAKTACCLIRYKREEVVAVLDSTQSGTTEQALGVGADVPFVSSLEQAPDANTLLIGIAPPGGKIPESWRSVILDAIGRGMDVISGLHDFLGMIRSSPQQPADRGSRSVTSDVTTKKRSPGALDYARSASASTPSVTIAALARW